jgi:hypothetical protein
MIISSCTFLSMKAVVITHYIKQRRGLLLRGETHCDVVSWDEQSTLCGGVDWQGRVTSLGMPERDRAERKTEMDE